MLSTVSGMLTLTRLLQSLNVLLSILAMPSGIFTLVSAVQPEKAELPILVTVSGMVTDFRLLQFANAPQAMLTTPSGIWTLTIPAQS